MGDVKLIFSYGLILDAIGVGSAIGCQDKLFQGKCKNPDTFFVCYNNQWHKVNGSSFNNIQLNFTSVCNCIGSTMVIEECGNGDIFSKLNRSTLEMGPSTTSSMATPTQNLTSAGPSTTSSMTTPPQNLTSDDMCPCDCEYADKIKFWNNKTNQLQQYYELETKLAQLKRLLSMDFKNLSSAYNKRICANDERPSAAVAGYVGATVLALVIGGIVMLDFPIITRQIRQLWRAVQNKVN